MLSDRPLVLYKDSDKKSKNETPSAKEAEQASLEWRHRREQRGLKVNLNDWMNNG